MGSSPVHADRELATAFLASVSHELRTPLNAVLGMLELSLDEPLSPTVREYLSTACESARTLAVNLNLMLELAQVDAEPLQLSAAPLDFHKIVRTAIAGLAVATQERVELRLSSDVETPLYGDEAHLGRLISTLIEQAARWLEHSKIVVEVGGQGSSHERFMLEIGISEYGLGSQDKRLQLGSFDQVELSRYASPGLALAVVQRWLDRVGGQLLTDSVTAGGRYYVQLPLSRVAPETAAVGSLVAAQQQQQQQPRSGPDDVPEEGFDGPLDVLVVDDTEANQKVVKAVLAKRGHRVELAGNGQQALDQLRRRRFDVVLMDAQMPLMNGFEATAAIRKLPEESRSHVPIIAMTAHALQEDRLRCLAAGMDDYLAKPIDVATLVAHVEFYGHSTQKPAAPAEHEPRPMPSQDFLAGARARLAGDEALLLELIRMFRQDANSLLEKVAAGLSSKDSELAARAAHNLRGLAANFDDARTVGAAGAVEKLAVQGDFQQAAAQMDTLRSECTRLVEALTDYERCQNTSNES